MEYAIVTGANGFLGSALIKKLIENNVKVLAIAKSFTESKLPICDMVTFYETDLSNTDEMIEKLKNEKYDVFYHFAWDGVNGPLKSDPIIQLKNTEITLNCAKVAKYINCKKFLCAGTIAERAIESLSNLDKTNGGMIYGVAKHTTRLMLETYCKNIGLDFVWMQFSNIYGPNNKTGNLVSYTIEEMIKGNNAIFGPALQPYDFIYIDDLIEAVIRLGKNKTRKNCYFIGSGSPRILKEYLIEIGKQYGRSDLIKIGLRPDDGIKYTLDMFNINELVNDVGNYIRVPFSDGIKNTLKQYKE